MRPWTERVYGIPAEQVVGSTLVTEFALQMLQSTTGAHGRRLSNIVHHDDAEWEYAYDRESHIGRLDHALYLAGPSGWWWSR